MKPTFIIELLNGGSYYALFYFIAFLAGLVILIKEGSKRKFPQVPWLLVITTSFLFFMAGTQIIKFSSEDWQRVLQFKALTHPNGRSVLGGILLGTVGLLLAKHCLRFRNNVMDAFAFAIPFGMLIQRFGCLWAGCCYGSTTSFPWGVQYSASSHAFNYQVHENIIHATNTLSLPVHPVPLYEVTGCLSIILLLLGLRKHLKVPGNLFITSIGLYTAARFCTEFFRATSFGIRNPSELTTVQLVILGLVPVLLILIIYREKQMAKNETHIVMKPAPDRYGLYYFLFITLLFLLVSRWLTKLEIMTMNLVMLPTLLIISWQVFKSITVPKLRLKTLGLMILTLFMMSQTLPEEHKSDSTKRAYNVFSLGTSVSYASFLLNDYDGIDCDDHQLDNSVSVYGIGLSRVEQKKTNTLQYGIEGYWGKQTEEYLGQKRNSSIAGIHPYLQSDWKQVGIGIGLHAGSLNQFTLPDNGTLTTQPTSIKKMNVFPSLYFRLGNVRKFYWEAKLAQQFPSPFPALTFQTDFGIAFKRMNGSAIRFGTGSHVGFFVAPTFTFGKHVIVEHYLGALPGLFSGKSSDATYEEIKQGGSFMGSINLRYKFGFKESPMK